MWLWIDCMLVYKYTTHFLFGPKLTVVGTADNIREKTHKCYTAGDWSALDEALDSSESLPLWIKLSSSLNTSLLIKTYNSKAFRCLQKLITYNIWWPMLFMLWFWFVKIYMWLFCKSLAGNFLLHYKTLFPVSPVVQ